MSYIPSGTGRLYLVDATGRRHKIRIHTRSGFTPAEAPIETRRSLDQDEGERSSVGTPGHGSFGFDFEPNPFLSSNRRLGAFHRNGGLCEVEEDRGGKPTVLQVGADGVREIAISAEGVLTTSGSTGIDLGTEARPRSPWTQGLGVIVGTQLFVVDEILTPTTARVSLWGTVAADTRTEGVPTGQRVAAETSLDTTFTAVAETHQYQLVQMGVRSNQSGRVSQGGGDEASGAGETASSGTVQLSSERNLSALLPAAA